MSNIVLPIVFGLVSFATLLATIRIISGPTIPDRAVGLDTATTITTAMIVLFAQIFHRAIYLDIALVYAVLAFLGVIAIARYLEGGM